MKGTLVCAGSRLPAVAVRPSAAARRGSPDAHSEAGSGHLTLEARPQSATATTNATDAGRTDDTGILISCRLRSLSATPSRISAVSFRNLDPGINNDV